MKAKQVTLNGIKTRYLIYEDGRLYSTVRGRFISQQVNNKGYIYYGISWLVGKNYFAHTIVALHFIGAQPEGMEVNHKDLDKRNNHWENLEWVTHSYNIMHARSADPWDTGRKPGFKVSAVTRRKMATVKYKPVRCIRGDEDMLFGSIEEFCGHFGTYRKKFNVLVNSIKTIDGWLVRYM